MSGNTFGNILKITTFGESHGRGIGVVIDGCPSGLDITAEEIQNDLDRRRPGQSRFTTSRQEKDRVEILSGIVDGRTLGTPIALLVYNHDANSGAYESIKNLYRPGHADYTYDVKYGARDWRGGGRASARVTLAQVAAGAIAKKLLSKIGVHIVGYVIQVGRVRVQKIDEAIVEKNELRCPDENAYSAFEKEIDDVKNAGDSVGGILEVVAHGVPAGWGEPVFHKLSADLSAAMFSIPAVKGFEIGDGFGSAAKHGSENNDEWVKKNNGVGTVSNHAGGIIGGISSGEDVVVRCALKPVSSIAKSQNTLNKNSEAVKINVEGRHDPCVCPRAVPIMEAMMALVLADHYLLARTNKI